MALAEILSIIALLAGAAKVHFDAAEKIDRRMDSLEREVSLLAQKIDNFSKEAFNNLEIFEAKMNMLHASQASFIQEVKYQISQLDGR